MPKYIKHSHFLRLIYINFLFFSLLFFFPPPLWSTAKINNNNTEKKQAGKKEEPPAIGNFSIPTPQQPGPLLSFGQHVIDKNQTQLFLFVDNYRGSKKHTVDVVPGLLFGVEDDFSIFLNVPIAASYKQDNSHSSGFEDIFIQGEYAFYTNKTSEFSDQATILTSISFPTGSANKHPPTGLGSSSFFLGTTLSRTYTDWFGFTSYGALFPTSSEKTKFGNNFLYQCGLGRNIFSITSELIISGMVEVTGLYMEKNKIRSKTDPNSGGNTVFITPSLWVSTQKFIIQLGFGLLATQHLFGKQKKNNYLLAANFGWTF